MAHASAVIDQRPAHDSKPAVTYRHAGDRYLMVEYGEMVLDMTLNFFVQAVDRLVREAGIEGLIETSPGFRSMLVGHDAAVLSRGDLIARLDDDPRRRPGPEPADDPEPADHAADHLRRLAVARGGGALPARHARRRPERRGRQQHRLHRPLQRAAGPRGAVRGGPGDGVVERVHRLLPGAAVHVPARHAARDLRPEVQPDPALDRRGRRRHRRAVRRDLPGRVARRLPALRAHHPDLRHPPAQRRVPRRPDPDQARRPRAVRAGRGGRAPRGLRRRARGPLPLPHRGRAVLGRGVAASRPPTTATRRPAARAVREQASRATPLP